MPDMDSWYKNAIIYGVELKVFYDGNGDGIGDLQGLTQKLDYLKWLGVTCIWLLPIYPSGNRDNGYDVIDYYNIDPDYGTLDEFKTLVKEADRRDIKIIMDLVVQHASTLHPWFQEARKDPKSKYRDFFVWSKKIPDGDFPESMPAFPGVEAGVWRYDGVAKAFYFHRFYYFEPDLNVAHPKVQEEIFNIVEFWLQFGISGFRVDGATLMFDRKGKKGTEVKNAVEFMEDLRAFIKKKNPDAILLGEADVEEEKVKFFFGSGDRMHLLYNFLLNRYIFLSLARGDSRPMQEELEILPVPPINAQWVNFLRNLDELNIEQLPPLQQNEVFESFGKDPYTQVYQRGIRRRIAPMFGGDIRRLKMAYSLVFSLPGATLISYGDEIGMGDNLDLPEREAVRLPMQWDGSQNGGFSDIKPQGLIAVVAEEGPYSYKRINVEIQKKDSASLLNHIKNLCLIRKYHPEIGNGEYRLIDTDPGTIFAISYNWPGGMVIVLHNLSINPCSVKLSGKEHVKLEDFFSDGEYLKEEKGISIPLNGYGFRWFLVKES